MTLAKKILIQSQKRTENGESKERGQKIGKGGNDGSWGISHPNVEVQKLPANQKREQKPKLLASKHHIQNRCCRSANNCTHLHSPIRTYTYLKYILVSIIRSIYALTNNLFAIHGIYNDTACITIIRARSWDVLTRPFLLTDLPYIYRPAVWYVLPADK